MKKQLFTTLFFVLFVFTIQCTIAQKQDSTKTKGHKKEQVKTTTKKADSKKIWNKVCPVMGNAVNPNAPTVQYKGKTIGFCCAGCDKTFQKDPDKYMKNLSEDGSKFTGEKEKE